MSKAKPVISQWSAIYEHDLSMTCGGCELARCDKERQPVFDAGRGIVAANGVGGLFRGFIPNAMKNMPNKSIQLTTFDVLKKNIKRSEAEYAKEVAALAAENKKIR